MVALSSPPYSLAGRVAIVTGSSRGIGRAVAIHLAELGAKVVINYTTRSTDADQVAAEINSSTGASPVAVVCRADISDSSQVESLFDAAEIAFNSPVHILVNSAGIVDPNYPSIANTPVDDFDRIFRVNTRGSFLCCKEASKRLKRGGGGRIILLTSSLTQALIPGQGAYTASKAAVEAMVKILAKELKGSGITANCVSPGPVATEMFFSGKTEETVRSIIERSPFGRLGETRDIAPVVGFLASDGGEWINGQVIVANGAFLK
ncbi:NAD(P)-binding Rossmann-fold superfamily protein [Raphanus sativus]|uniref:NADPH-dependent aldehyde reductase-like protein, chloroplastic n=1 Tax=Raphanus sativus TaxID=3726 RepID=A0A6J0K8W2_RAPSA|nr:NADPH-dependent aldehyde reductase-like protein, chloroplastic [Raphanus sativus]KAJ4882561.1 NAD(P)-binding Rossmann-fold superfamily protein [Raphanus sativus]